MEAMSREAKLFLATHGTPHTAGNLALKPFLIIGERRGAGF